MSLKLALFALIMVALAVIVVTLAINADEILKILGRIALIAGLVVALVVGLVFWLKK